MSVEVVVSSRANRMRMVMCWAPFYAVVRILNQETHVSSHRGSLSNLQLVAARYLLAANPNRRLKIIDILLSLPQVALVASGCNRLDQTLYRLEHHKATTSECAYQEIKFWTDRNMKAFLSQQRRCHECQHFSGVSWPLSSPGVSVTSLLPVVPLRQ